MEACGAVSGAVSGAVCVVGWVHECVCRFDAAPFAASLASKYCMSLISPIHAPASPSGFESRAPGNDSRILEYLARRHATPPPCLPKRFEQPRRTAERQKVLLVHVQLLVGELDGPTLGQYPPDHDQVDPEIEHAPTRRGEQWRSTRHVIDTE
eukprot:6205985-Pleurochrysis_carterae.AAC.4